MSAALFAPPFAVCWFIWSFGVNVPYLDEWTLAADLQRAVTFRGLITSLFIGDNDHAILVPKLIFITLAELTDWNTKVNMFVVFVCSLIAFLVIARIANAEEDNSRVHTTWLALFISSLLMFSFVHYDTWLHGWSLTHDLGDTCAILAIFVLVNPKRNPALRLAVSAVLCLTGSLCYLGGLAAWFAVIPCTLIMFEDRRSQVLAAAGSIGLCLATLLLFRLAFIFWPMPTDRLFWLKHPDSSTEYFLSLLGAPLAQTGSPYAYSLAPFLGAALIALLLLTLITAFHTPHSQKMVPWISMVLFGLGVALMNTLGHGSWGSEVAAVTSRYMVDSVIVAIAVLQLLRQALPKWEFTVVALAVGTLSLWCSKNAITRATVIREERTQAADCLVAANYVDQRTDDTPLNPLFELCPFPDLKCGRYVLRPGLRTAARLGFWGMTDPDRVPFVDERNEVYGAIERPILQGDVFDLRGWVAMPQGSAPPTCVLVTAGRRGVLAKALKIPDGTTQGGKNQLSDSLQVHWSVAIPASLLPQGASTLEAWIYNHGKREFAKLDGEEIVSKEP
jgi:hypothetical protein